MQVLVWQHKDDWSQAKPKLLTSIKHALDKSGIEIPHPQHVIWEVKD
jgi:small-conductance mechanosensitive channel